MLPQGGTPYDSLLRQTLARWFTAFELWVAPIAVQRRSATQPERVSYSDDVVAVSIGPTASYTPVAGWATYAMSGTTGSRLLLQSGGVVRGALQADATATYLDYSPGILMIRRGPTTIEVARFNAAGQLIMNGAGAAGRINLNFGIGTEDGVSTNATGTFAACWAAVYRVNGLTAGSVSHPTATTTSFNTTSDRRLKDSIVDAPSALGLINRLRVRSFDWRSDGVHVSHSFIAQELDAVFPGAVTKGTDDGEGEDLADGVMPWGIDPSKLVGLLTRAIQELQGQIDALKDALKGKG